MLSTLRDILEFNKKFVENKKYKPYVTTKFPDKKYCIITCMDTRLTQLLPKALNLRNGDAKIIKTAGAIVSHPFGSVMRSLMVAIYELGVKEVFVIGHYDCGMENVNPSKIIEKMTVHGIDKSTLDILSYSGLNLEAWLRGFDSVEESVKKSVEIICNHPLIPKNIFVYGLMIDPQTGKLDVVCDGRSNNKN